MTKISFFDQDRKARFPKKETKQSIMSAIADMGLLAGDINYIFCSDDYLLKMNQEYLSHDTLTDVITFDYTEEDVLMGDIFISLDRVCENAQLFHVKQNEELFRVMIHGVLHLAGYKDKTKADQTIMRQMEDLLLNSFFIKTKKES
ncbi:MAG: rRNA maturation RNase YbeY [Bacteroidales bacterium]